jgi:iron complex outermembrane receptor protein
MATAGVMLEDRRGGGDVPGGGSFEQDLRTARTDAGATGRTLIGNALLLDYRASAALTLHDHRFGARRERDRHTTLFAETSLRGQSGGHRWAAGLAVQRDGYDERDVEGFDYKYWTPGFFAQEEVDLGSRLTVSASARLDRHSRYGTFLSPRESLLGRPGNVVTLRLSAGTGFFAPTPFTEETEEIGLGVVEPLAGLEAERARSASADVAFTMRGIEANFTIFGSDIDDAVTVIASSDGSRAELVNLPCPA